MNLEYLDIDQDENHHRYAEMDDSPSPGFAGFISALVMIIIFASLLSAAIN